MADDPQAATSPASPADLYAAQKANIRDTAKWMATAFAAIVTVILAGAPFSGLGALPWGHLAMAIVAGGISVACILIAIKEILRLLIGNYCFASSLDPSVRAFINQHAVDVLPPQFKTLEEFEKHRNVVRPEIVKLWTELTPPRYFVHAPEERAKLKASHDDLVAVWKDLDINTNAIISLGHLYLLRNGLHLLRGRLAMLTIIAVASLVAAIWAVTPEKKTKVEAVWPLVWPIASGSSAQCGTNR